MAHYFHFDAVPKATPNRALPDGAVTGNGDLAVIWAGEPDRLRLYFSKSDFWRAIPGDRTQGGQAPIGYIEIGQPLLADSGYDVTENIDEAYIEGKFEAAHTTTTVRNIACATDNIILVELKVKRPGSSVDVLLKPVPDGEAVSSYSREGDIQVITREFRGEELWFDTAACAAMVEVSRRREGNYDIIRYAVAVVTNHDNPAYVAMAKQKILVFDDAKYDSLLAEHSEWWKEFWAKSSVSIEDKEIENNWYAGLYILACCARNEKFPPGLWGNFSTQDNMPWKSDYHMNYNFQAPFYGLPSANHLELMDCIDFSVEQYIPFAEYYARKFLGCRGVYFAVGFGPMGLDTSCIEGTKEHSRLFLGQKSNAAFMATDTVMRWNAGREIEYAKKHAYPFLKKVGEFWEDYLSYENGRYVDYNDSIHEVGYYSSTEYHPTEHDEVNPVISLGLIRMVLNCLIDMSKALGVDEDRRGKWQHIVDNLSKPVIFTGDDGKEYIRATEEGMQYTNLSLQYMYPAGQLGSRSESRVLAAMNNVAEKASEWVDDNRFCTFYPTAVRLGFKPAEILDGMHRMIEARGLGNGLFKCGGGGIENNSAIVTTIDEMLLQSFEGVVRLFPDWDLSSDASYSNLRADGAFLVTASLKDGVIDAEIVSEKGGMLNVEAPAGGSYVLVKGSETIPFEDKDISVMTVPGDTVQIRKA